MSVKPRPLFPPDIARDVEDELSSHLEMRREELTATGVAPDVAAQRAAARFGDMARFARECRAIDEAWYRSERQARMWTDLRQDVAYGCRLLLKSPGFTTLAAVTLALGIGATTAVFSVADAVLLRPLPYPEPHRLVEILVEVKQRSGRVSRLAPSVPDTIRWREDGQVFSHLAVWRNVIQPAVLDGAEPERVSVRQVSEDYLALHGVSPPLGRDFTRDDMKEGAPAVALIGHAFWQTRFGGDRGVINRVIRLDDEPVTIVGVLPRTFYPDAQVWGPYPAWGMHAEMRGSGANVYGRLRPGVTLQQAARRLTDLTASVDRAKGEAEPPTVAVESLLEDTIAGYTSTTNLLFAAVVSIMLIACINVAGLLLARGAARQGELAIRASIGAGRFRLLRQLLTESLVLSVLGGALGVLLAWVAVDALVANLPFTLPPNSPVEVNTRVLGFALGLSAATGLLFGLIPAVRLSRTDLSRTLSRADRRHGSPLSRRGGRFLIAAEVALALVLLAGAGLMIRSFGRILAVDLGVDPERFVTVEVVPIETDEAVLKRYYPALVASLSDLPGIEAAGAVDYAPLVGGSMVTMALGAGKPFSIHVRNFVPGYFEAVGIPLVDGRLPTAAEIGAGSPAAVINERAARELAPGKSAVGRTFQLADKRVVQVAGVVRDVRHSGPLRDASAEVYFGFGTGSIHPLVVVVRTQMRASAVAAQLRETAAAVGPRVVVSRIRQGSEWFDDRVATPRRRTVLLGLLGGLGLLLTLVGVFGMTAYAVARRTQEIGVRMTFGARPSEVVWTMLRDALWPVAIGVVLGIVGAVVSTRLIASFLFDTEATDPATFAAVAVAVGIAACMAAWLPARRAAHVDPIAALRSE